MLKRELIDLLRKGGTAPTTAAKEYVDCPEWIAHAEKLTALQETKRDADDDESLLRQRVLTLRAVMLPLSVSMLSGVRIDFDATDSASEDEAFSEAAR